MIQQPELGKKIAHYRKAKGLTQEELVEKCNVSVRTLQRIEAGEVTPRAYTVKLIFDALELDFDSTQNSPQGSKQGLLKRWLEQFYISFLDLFNLKTNTMKKISILSLMLTSILFGIFTLIGNAQNKNGKATPITENKGIINQSDVKMIDGSISCTSCFYDDDDFVGYGVKFKKDGVSVNVQLLKLNTKTGKFNAGFIKGVLFPNKVEVNANKDWINKKRINFEAEDSLHTYDNKLVLKGNAKLRSPQNELIEANEIVIYLK